MHDERTILGRLLEGLLELSAEILGGCLEFAISFLLGLLF